MSRSKRTLKIFTFPVCDDNDNPLPGCSVHYNREDGYSAYFNDGLIGFCTSKTEAETMSAEAYYSSIRKAA